MGNKSSPTYVPAGNTGINGNPENPGPPEHTGATDGVDSVDHTRIIDGITTCTCADDMTPALYCNATVETVANHEMAPAGGTTPTDQF